MIAHLLQMDTSGMFTPTQQMTFNANTVIMQVCVNGMPSNIQAGFQVPTPRSAARPMHTADMTRTDLRRRVARSRPLQYGGDLDERLHRRLQQPVSPLHVSGSHRCRGQVCSSRCSVCVFWASAAPVMLCYDASRRAFVLLGPQGVGVNSQSAPMPVDYANTIWPATITLSPWQAEVFTAYPKVYQRVP